MGGGAVASLCLGGALSCALRMGEAGETGGLDVSLELLLSARTVKDGDCEGVVTTVAADCLVRLLDPLLGGVGCGGVTGLDAGWILIMRG